MGNRRSGIIKKTEVLKKLAIGRNGAVQVQTEAKIGSVAYDQAGEVMESIDRLAEDLTGDQRHFHLKPHGKG